MADTAPIGPKTVTVLGSHWKEGPLWTGFDWTRAELRSASIWSNDDYHLGVPWMHPNDISRYGRNKDMSGIYRLRLKSGWKSFVRIGDEWRVSKAPPTERGPFGTPPDGQVHIIEIAP